MLTEEDITQLGSIPLQKGVFQKDSIPSLLFVWDVQLLTKALHSQLETLAIGDSNHNMALNRLLFMGGLKPFVCKTYSPSKFLSKTKKFFTEIGLHLNTQKSTRFSDYTEVETLYDLSIIGTERFYKYLDFSQTTKPYKWQTRRNSSNWHTNGWHEW